MQTILDKLLVQEILVFFVRLLVLEFKGKPKLIEV